MISTISHILLTLEKWMERKEVMESWNDRVLTYHGMSACPERQH